MLLLPLLGSLFYIDIAIFTESYQQAQNWTTYFMEIDCKLQKFHEDINS
jgi:hypothetical protein